MNNMQEQHHYKITPEQGWAKMRPTLDEAMPVGNASRRYPFLWWTTTAVVLAGLVGFTFLKDTIAEGNSSTVINRAAIVPAIGQHINQQNNINSINTSASQSTETKEVIISTESTIPAQPTIEEKELIKPTIEPKATKTTSKSQSSKRADQKKSVSIPMAVIDEKALENSTLQGESVIEPIVANGDNSQDILEANSFVEPAMVASVPLRNERVVDAIPALFEVSFNSPEYHQDLVPSGTVIKSKRQPSFIEPGLAASGFIGHEGGIGGLIGAGAQMNVSRRFCITSSMGFFTYNPNSALFGGSRTFDSNVGQSPILNYDPSNIGNEIYVLEEAISNHSGYNTINPLVDKITQWQINAGVKWKFSRRFFAEGGVTVGLFTKGYSIYPIAQEAFLGTTPGLKFQNELNDFDVIRSTTTSLYAGMGYRLGQHFDVFANWNHSLNPYLLNETEESSADLDSGKRTDYIRGLSVGVRYTL
jgi:hypothetical protein